MRKAALILSSLLTFSSLLHADTQGTIQGRLTDPSGAFVAGAAVQLVGVLNAQQRSTVTNAEGRFEFTFMEAGPYRIKASLEGFHPIEQQVTVTSGQSTGMQLQFTALADISTEITVSAGAAGTDIQNASVQTNLSSELVEHMAGATDSTAAIEAQTGTAWRSQEHLHIRGAHQVQYQVNGIPIPDQSLFGAITPFIDARNLKYAEITTGGLLPEYGNRTAGVVNAIARSGFDPGEHGRFEVTGGNLRRGSAFASVGDHIGDKFGYYLQAGSLVSARGFDPPPDRLTFANILSAPQRQDIHNDRRTWQSFANLEWRPTAKDSLNLVAGGYRTDFQIPNTVGQQLAGRDYVQFERDQFQNLRWTRSISGDTLLTVSVYHHFNKLEVDGRADEPSVPLAGDNRRANSYGSEASLAQHLGRHLLKFGDGVFFTRLRDDFSILSNPADPTSSQATPLASRVPSHSLENSAYVQDQFDPTDRLTLNFGGRLDAFSASYQSRLTPGLSQHETFFSPRLGFSYKFTSRVALFANGAYLLVLPPIEYFELPQNTGQTNAVFPPGVSFTPARPERDLQYDVGVRFTVAGQQIRVNQWFKRQILFLDHVQLTQLNGLGQLINPNIFLPVNLDRGRTHGVEVFLQTASHHGVHATVNYSLNYAQVIGGILHGFNDGLAPSPSYFFADHDQRHRVVANLDYDIERAKAFVDVTYNFGSGFPDASNTLLGTCVTPSCRLPSHSTVSATVGRKLTNHVDARLEMENITNAVYPINLGSDFNGSHFSPPRMTTLRFTYRF
jgi:outer membrane receptor for ferrienterochelin and colicin